MIGTFWKRSDLILLLFITEGVHVLLCIVPAYRWSTCIRSHGIWKILVVSFISTPKSGDDKFIRLVLTLTIYIKYTGQKQVFCVARPVKWYNWEQPYALVMYIGKHHICIERVKATSM